VQFQIDDAEADWTFPPNHFDFIHARTLGGSIGDMSGLIKQCYKHLKPGGWLGIDECEIWPKSDDGSLTPKHALSIWFDYLDKSSTQIGKKLNIAEEYKKLVKDAGFEDVRDDTYKVRSADFPPAVPQSKLTDGLDPFRPLSELGPKINVSRNSVSGSCLRRRKGLSLTLSLCLPGC